MTMNNSQDKKFNTEFEAVFSNIDKREVRARLKRIGAKLLIAEAIQTRKVFYLPEDKNNGFVRVRKEITGKITLTIKKFVSQEINGQKEIETIVDDFKKAVNLLEALGLKQKAFQETKRELWKFNEVKIMIDEWPFLEPFIEIEGNSEDIVKKISTLLGFDYKKAIFGPVTILYSKKYGISEDQINNKIPQIIFNMENPFI